MALRVLPRKAWRNRWRSADPRIPLHLTAAEDASRRLLRATVPAAPTGPTVPSGPAFSAEGSR